MNDPGNLALGGNDWGSLPLEPCRFCGRRGGVEFLASENPLDRAGPQVVRCVLCKRAWDTDGKELT